MDPEPRARVSPAKSAARMATPRRRLRWLILLAGLMSLGLGLGLARSLRLSKTTQARQTAEGVLLAQRRAGEISEGAAMPVAVARSPQSELPASPTPLAMPTLPPNAGPAAEPRYLIHDSLPPRPRPGHLYVDTQPGSVVWIDDEAKGKTPLDVMVGPGHKKLRLEAPGFRPVRESFEADQGAVIRRALVPLAAPQ